MWGTQAFPCLLCVNSGCISLLWYLLAACSLSYHLLCREAPSLGDGEMLFCFAVKDQPKHSPSFSASYSLLLKCPGFCCLFSIPCRKVFSRLWVKDGGIALVLLLEIAASDCTSSTTSVREGKKHPLYLIIGIFQFFSCVWITCNLPFCANNFPEAFLHALSSAPCDSLCLFDPGPQGMFWKLACEKCFLWFV